MSDAVGGTGPQPPLSGPGGPTPPRSGRGESGRGTAPPGSRAARTRGFTVFAVRGVPVRVDLSWFLIAGLVAYSYGSRMSDDIVALRGVGTPVIWGAAVVAALLFFASLLAHEFGHAFTSLDRGIPVVGITLFLLGGVTESTREARRARDEFVIVGIGPFISLVLAGAFGLVFTALRGWPVPAAVVGYLAWTNLALAFFNVLPGYPLDGGRLLRSVLWMITGRPHTATRWAARVGQVFAGLLLAGAAWGLLGLPLVGPRWLRIGVAVLSSVGLWGGLIGFFLYRGATDAHRSATMRERWAGRRVRDVMGTVPPTLPPSASLAAVADVLGRKPSLLWPVGEPVRGLIRLQDLDAVSADRWAATPVTDVAATPDGRVIDADASLDRAARVLLAAPEHQLVVVEGGRAVGLLTESLLVALDR